MLPPVMLECLSATPTPCTVQTFERARATANKVVSLQPAVYADGVGAVVGTHLELHVLTGDPALESRPSDDPIGPMCAD
jgi:hypothetical protein